GRRRGRLAGPGRARGRSQPPGPAGRRGPGPPSPRRGGRAVGGRAGRFDTARALVRRDGTVVAVHGGTAWVSTGAPGAAATRLGPASYALAATDPRRVWLVEETGDPERWFRLREVRVGGPA